MERMTRTFKLRVSPKGFDLLALCHHRMLVATRVLLPYGATLTAAMEHLSRTVIDEEAMTSFTSEVNGLAGQLTVFVGAPHWVGAKAAEISRISDGEIAMGDVYLIALKRLSAVSPKSLAVLHDEVGTGRPLELQ
jgi:hypothetical protein